MDREKRAKETESPATEDSRLASIVKDLYMSLAHQRYDTPFILLLLLSEAVLCRFILRRVAYTEIDWEAYMQEVETWQSGELDYRKIRGPTGPLVYPAGFLYLYAWLREISVQGTHIAAAQEVFYYFYLFMISLVLYIYSMVSRRFLVADSIRKKRRSQLLEQAHRVWSWRLAMAICCLSKRLHSIYLLRLFNDGPAMILLFLSVALFAKSFWKLGCVVYSLAVSIKMNILLFAPGLLLLLLQSSTSPLGCVVCLGICGVVQLILGAPFLLAYPQSYIRKAFEFDRVFFYKWTVNWKFLSEDAFVSKSLSVLLLAFHLAVLAVLAARWLRSTKTLTGRHLFLGRPLAPDYVVYTLFLSNFVGICFARTLHYQFYSWYCSTVPFLLWRTGAYPILVRLGLIGAMEYAFLIFPATPASSRLLQVAHLLTLVASMQSPSAMGMSVTIDDDNKDTDKSNRYRQKDD